MGLEKGFLSELWGQKTWEEVGLGGQAPLIQLAFCI